MYLGVGSAKNEERVPNAFICAWCSYPCVFLHYVLQSRVYSTVFFLFVGKFVYAHTVRTYLCPLSCAIGIFTCVQLANTIVALVSVCALHCHLQVLCLSKQILFTQRCEEAISGGSMQELLI